ncbi:hypothetical protein EC988_005905 [Linderina pennispora]|nr:hypothetical protein EC988_005905 [Linderina pennispora]
MLPKPDHKASAKPERALRAPTPLRQSTSAAEASEDGDATQSKDTLAAAPPSVSPTPSMPSSISTLNIDADVPLAAKGPGVSAKSIVSNVTSVGGAVVGGTVTGISSLLSYVTPGTPKQRNKSSGGLPSQDELIAQALVRDPEREQRVVDMAHDEKLSTLSVLRDQRERVKGYIREAQRERRLEDAVSLQTSLSDLEVELSLIERNL